MTGSRAGTGVGPDPDADVTASEIASYAYCAKAWHLRQVLDEAPSRQAAVRQEAGVLAHLNHGARVKRLAWLERRAGSLIAALLVIGALLLGLAIVWSRVGVGGR